MLPLLLASSIHAAAPVIDRVPALADEFQPSAVKLLPSPFATAMAANDRVLIALEPDRLLHSFRTNAGLPAKAPAYGGWESQGVAGHTLGHYLSAISKEFAATQSPVLKKRVDYIVSELSLCQSKRADGYIGAIPDGDRIWAEIKKGDVRSSGFDLNGGWVPWYTLHKDFAGLLDAYRYTGSKQALVVAKKLGDWAIDETAALTPDKWQLMLGCEHGGMNEAFANLYGFTGDRRYLEIGRKFYHKEVLDPLAEAKDQLAGHHANTQIPKIIGMARLYELEAQPNDKAIAVNFWNAIVNHHSYVNGGNSNYEHLQDPDKLNDQLSDNTSETCNTYNMLKLTTHLFRWEPSATYADYYERALYNHILASQDPADGMVCYYVPLVSGGARTYSTPTESFWCCVGTGIENHTQYGQAIYYHHGRERLWVNLFIPSDLTWKEAGVIIHQRTDFPSSGKILLRVESKARSRFELKIRHPKWAQAPLTVSVNGTAVALSNQPESYVTIKRVWNPGDRVTFTLPMPLHTESMPDNPKRLALFKGPVLLAADLGPTSAEVKRAPVLVTSDQPVDTWLRSTGPLTYITTGVAKPDPLTFKPFYTISHNRYAVYLDTFDVEGWRKQEEIYRQEEEQARELAARTVDYLRPGEMQPERDHNFQGEKVETGEFKKRKWRHALSGGWFSFDMAVDPSKPNALVLTYWGSDAGDREFDILVDGKKIATQKLEREKPDVFFDVRYEIPSELLEGKKKVTIKLQALPTKLAGGLYGARVVRG